MHSIFGTPWQKGKLTPLLNGPPEIPALHDHTITHCFSPHNESVSEIRLFLNQYTVPGVLSSRDMRQL